ncbi:hypothetical protein E2C01_039503 [Portunus trituberculatus]|uniref:Regulatory protein zeste n=1 Tax=Portunus trituberculatus TaxID=210409 RepID=A0A5B7FJU8_PORTR|nr:hypothetical protein [Portunus trituberculatus]
MITEVLVELVKEHFDVLNDKSTKFYALNKKAQAWQEIAGKFCDSTGHLKTPLQLHKIWENIKASRLATLKRPAAVGPLE